MKIALFASGTGSNVQAIINHFRGSAVTPALIITNNAAAGVLGIAGRENIESLVVDAGETGAQAFISQLKDRDIELIVLAGYLKKIPDNLIKAFPDRIINIHPALLPKYGGKGMYGLRVHMKVVEMKERTSGITIHYVNEHYDEGRVLLQAICPVHPDDTPEMVAARVLELEHFYYPRVIEFILKP